MDVKTVNKILMNLENKKIGYCILRNYEDIGGNKDIDILIKHKDARKVKKILIGLGLVKRLWGWGPYLICDCRADIKIGCIDCDGRFYRKATEVLKRKKPRKNFYILCEEDELEHLVVHAIVTKGYFKKEYKRKVEDLMKKCNLEVVEKKLKSKFGKVGKNAFGLVRKKDYEGALTCRKEMQKEVRTLKNMAKYYFYRIHFLCKKKVLK